MTDPLIELETAARLAAEVSTLGLSIRIEIAAEGVRVIGTVIRGTSIEGHHEFRLSWQQLHFNPGMLSPAVKRVEWVLRPFPLDRPAPHPRTVNVVDLGEGMP